MKHFPRAIQAFILVLVTFFCTDTLLAQRGRGDENNQFPPVNSRPEPDTRTQPATQGKFMQRLVVGGGLNLGYANGWNIGVSPMVAYRTTDFWWVGVNTTYFYSQFIDNIRGFRVHNHVYGAGLFTRLAPLANTQLDFLSNIYLHAEYENLWYNARVRQNGQSFNLGTVRASGVLLGGGYTTNFGRGSGFTVDILYNMLWTDQESPYPSPLVIRTGFTYGF
jgi:hypothetical protein